MKWSVVLVLILLIGCAVEPQLEPPREREPVAVVEDTVRPVIDRVNVSIQDSNQESSSSPSATRRSFLDSVSDYTRSALIAGDDRHPLLLGVTLGEVLPELERKDLPLLAMQQPTFHGQTLRAEPIIRFDFEKNSTGVLRFVRGDDDVVTSELFFEEDKPIFEYAYLLYDGAFPVMEGEELDFFGTRYVIKEVSEKALVLYGVDGEQYLSLVNNSLLSVNGQKYAHTNVLVDPYSVIIQYFATDIDDGGIVLRPGEGLRSKLVAPLLNPIFDVIYDGMDSNVNASLHVDSVGSRARLSFFNAIGEKAQIDIAAVDGNNIVFGDGEHKYHYLECKSFDDFCIRAHDEFAVIARDGTMRIFEFRSVNDEGNTLTLSDSSGERHIVKVKEMSRNVSGLQLLDGTFSFRDTAFRLRVLHNESVREGSRISVDLDGSGSPSGKQVPIALFFGYEIEIPAKNQSNTSKVLILHGNDVRRDIGTERMVIRLVPDGDEVRISVEGNFTLFEDEDDEELFFGMSGIGSFVTLDNVESSIGKRLLVQYPYDYRFGLVRIVG